IALASVAGAEICHLIRGDNNLFAHQQFHMDLVEIFACIGLALVTACASILLTRLLRYSHARVSRFSMPLWLKAGLGGCVVGVIGTRMPVVLGEGYHSIQAMIQGVFEGGFLLVAAAILAKILATSLTLGSGGSGGIFAPCLVIGSLVGVAYYKCLELVWPTVSWVNEGCFAMLGMAGLVGGILQAPLTGIFLIVEISGGYGVILPLIIVSAISSTLCHYIEPASFYLKDLVERGHLLRPGTDARVLSDLSILELLEEDCITVRPGMLLKDFIGVVKTSNRNHFPVEDEETGEYLGMVHVHEIRPYIFDPLMHDAVILEQIMDDGVPVVHPEDDLAQVLDMMDDKRLYSAPVISNQRFLGMISKATLLDQYRKELRVQMTQ
ncbi:MAG: chloride channel protein, partial [Desulfobacterales bacterium]|nr:chloride channel protein [Desulfobacterales bacterium]